MKLIDQRVQPATKVLPQHIIYNYEWLYYAAVGLLQYISVSFSYQSLRIFKRNCTRSLPIQTHMGCWRGLAVTRLIRSTKLLYAGPRVSTAMRDCLRAGKPSRYLTSNLGQLSFPSLRSM